MSLIDTRLGIGNKHCHFCIDAWSTINEIFCRVARKSNFSIDNRSFEERNLEAWGSIKKLQINQGTETRGNYVKRSTVKPRRIVRGKKV
jgi:hypothetical protein